MARKWKNTKKNPRQHPTVPEPLSPQSTIPDIKISEAVLKLCEPLRQKYREPHQTQGIISMTVMAWNVSLFENEDQDHVRGILVDALSKQLVRQDVAVLLGSLETLIAQKRKDYPHVREYILKHQLSFSGDAMTLTVATSSVPDKIQRRVT